MINETGQRVTYRPSCGALVETTLERVAVDDLLQAQPVREFRWYKGRTYYSGWYWSATMQAMVAYESRLELARILLADFDFGVCGIVAQPFVMEQHTSAGLRRHVPDLLLVGRDGTVTVVDVKPARRLADPLVRRVFDWTAESVGLRGWGFEEWSGAELVLIENVRFLAGYRRSWLIDAALAQAVMDVLGCGQTIGGIERQLADDAPARLVRPAVLHLLWAGALQTDLSVPLNSSSPLLRAENR